MGPFTKLYLEKVAGKYFPDLIDGEVRSNITPKSREYFIGSARKRINDVKKRLRREKKDRWKVRATMTGLPAVFGAWLGSELSKKPRNMGLGALGGALVGAPLSLLYKGSVPQVRKDLDRAKKELETTRTRKYYKSTPSEWANLGLMDTPEEDQSGRDWYKDTMISYMEEKAKKLNSAQRRVYEREKRKFLSGISEEYKKKLKNRGVL
jgi:hypothetical protein